MVIVTPGGFENYLQEIGIYSPATDMAKIIEISKETLHKFCDVGVND